MKRAATVAAALLLLASGALAEPRGPAVWLSARLPQTFTAPDRTRYVFSPDGLATLVERPDGTRSLLASAEYVESATEPASGGDFGSAGTCGGLYYTGARYYNPCLGIFLTRDPAPVDITDPWTLNPYAYGRANPLRYVDPTGRQAVPPDEVYFRDQELRALPPAEQARRRETDARSAVGGLLGAAEFFARTAWGTLTSAVGYRYEETGERIVEALSEPRQALEEAKEGVKETIAEAERLAVAGEDLQAGRVLTRDLVAPAATAALTAGEFSVAAGRRLLTLPRRPGLVPIPAALEADRAFIVAEDGAQLIGEARPPRPSAGRPPLRVVPRGPPPLEVEGFRLGRHGEMPSPRAGMESHHGAMSRWMEEHYAGYDPNQAPAVLMPKPAHDATRAVYNRWRAQMRQQMGGTFDWARVSEPDIRALGDKMFQAATAPPQIQQGYWQWFDRMKRALERQEVAR